MTRFIVALALALALMVSTLAVHSRLRGGSGVTVPEAATTARRLWV